MLKKFLFILFSCVMLVPIFGLEESLSYEDKKFLVSNLNYLQYSVSKISDTDNKLIAKDEYYSVINELNINLIKNEELNDEYKKFLTSCSELHLNQNEINFLKQVNQKQKKNAWKKAFSNMGSIFVPGADLVQTAISLVYTATANVISIENEKSELDAQLEKDLFYLNQKDLKQMYSMQTNLFTTASSLLGNQDVDVITQDSMKEFIQISKMPSASERCIALEEKVLQNNMKDFPPYWYELGNAYQKNGEFDKALNAYDKFEKLKKYDVLKRDSTYVKLLKNKIQILLGLSSDFSKINENINKNKMKILECIDKIDANIIDSRAGEKNSYFAKIYFLLGANKKSMEYIDYILNTKSINGDYLHEVILIKSLIKAAYEDSILYDNLISANEIKFGHKCELFNNIFNDYFDKNFLIKNKDRVLGFVKEIFTESEDVESSFSPTTYNNYERDKNKEFSTKFIDDKNLYFSLPVRLLDQKSFYVLVGDKSFIPQFIIGNGIEALFYIDCPIKDIDAHIKFIFNNEQDGSFQEIEVQVKNINDNYLKNAEKALDRVGASIYSYNADIVNLLGETLTENRFKYVVDDIEKLREKVEKEEIKKNKKRTVPQTKSVVDTQIHITISNRLADDQNNITQVLNNVCKDYYGRSNVASMPEIVSIYDSFYSIGVLSIYDSNTNSKLFFDATGDGHLEEELKMSNVPMALSDLHKYALGGDIISNIELGIAYYDGNGVDVDYTEAMKWFFRAFSLSKQQESSSTEKLKLSVAAKYIADAYTNGKGVLKNKNYSTIWLTESDKILVDN